MVGAGAGGSGHQAGPPFEPFVRACSNSAAKSGNGDAAWASWTTVPCASRGWRNASFQRGSSSEMPTGVYPDVRTRSRVAARSDDLEREVVGPGAVAGDEALQEVEAFRVPGFEELDRHAVDGVAETYLVGAEPDVLAAHHDEAPEIADERLEGGAARRGSPTAT